MEYLRRSDAAKLASEKTLIGFGAGVFGARTQSLLDGLIEFFVDNEEKKWNRPWEGEVPVHSPEVLKEYNPDSIVVVICSEQYKIIEKQLREILPKATMLLTPLLQDYEVFERLLNCSQNLLVSFGRNLGRFLNLFKNN